MRRSSRRANNLYDDPRLRPARQFGGSLLKQSHAKVARPVSVRRAMHIVLQSGVAEGVWSLSHQKNRHLVEKIVRSQAKKYQVSVRELGNFGRALHLLVKLRHKKSFAPFIRSVSGMIALAVTGSGKTRGLKQKFWDFRPWSRIIDLLRSYSVVTDEVVSQHLISIGMLGFLRTRRGQISESS